MRVLGVTLLLLAATSVWADSCVCSTSQNDAPGGFFSFFTSYPNRVPCHVDSCTYIANTTDIDTGIGNINIVSFIGNATIKIYDGSETGQPVFTITSPPNNAMAAQLQAFKSYNPYITIVADETTDQTNLVSVVVVMQLYPGRKTTNPPTTTTPAPTTTPYSGNYSRNPALVALDLAFAVDTAGDHNSTQEMIAVIQNMAGFLSVNPSPTQIDSSRLSLQQLVSLPTDGFLAPPWTLEVDSFIQSLEIIRAYGASAYWQSAIDAIFAHGFSNSTRAHAERTYFMFVQSIPFDLTSQSFIDNYEHEFVNNNVHVAVIDFASNATSQQYFKEVMERVKNLEYYVYNVSDPNSFQNLMDTVLIGSDALQNFGCASTLKDTTNVDVVGPTIYQMPATQAIGPFPSFYCNFQTTNKIFTTNKGCLLFSVDFYELEVEKDYLKFYSIVNGKEIEQVSLTGIDVSKSEFRIPSNSTKVSFLTNENNVFNGFNLTVSACN